MAADRRRRPGRVRPRPLRRQRARRRGPGHARHLRRPAHRQQRHGADHRHRRRPVRRRPALRPGRGPDAVHPLHLGRGRGRRRRRRRAEPAGHRRRGPGHGRLPLLGPRRPLRAPRPAGRGVPLQQQQLLRRPRDLGDGVLPRRRLHQRPDRHHRLRADRPGPGAPGPADAAAVPARGAEHPERRWLEQHPARGLDRRLDDRRRRFDHHPARLWRRWLHPGHSPCDGRRRNRWRRPRRPRRCRRRRPRHRWRWRWRQHRRRRRWRRRRPGRGDADQGRGDGAVPGLGHRSSGGREAGRLCRGPGEPLTHPVPGPTETPVRQLPYGGLVRLMRPGRLGGPPRGRGTSSAATLGPTAARMTSAARRLVHQGQTCKEPVSAGPPARSNGFLLDHDAHPPPGGGITLGVRGIPPDSDHRSGPPGPSRQGQGYDRADRPPTPGETHLFNR
ncbi:hypothetical protein NOCARDAX2BIS_480009 [Nocardioides sp. AX2bis]|nr:hypothetical protein NOCARDAX2BIS_480009 [Nocardioides sp. AX2bis]